MTYETMKEEAPKPLDLGFIERQRKTAVACQLLGPKNHFLEVHASAMLVELRSRLESTKVESPIAIVPNASASRTIHIVEAPTAPSPTSSSTIRKYSFSVNDRIYETDERSLSGAEIKHRANIDSTYQLVDCSIPWHGEMDPRVSDLHAVDLTQGIKKLWAIPPATY